MAKPEIAAKRRKRRKGAEKEMFSRRFYGFSQRLLSMLGLALMCGASQLKGGESWPEVLARMPLGNINHELNQSNCGPVLLEAFTSNQVVKALIFMPGASDEFYLFRPTRVAVTQPQPSLWDAIVALTNQTRIRATFRQSMLLLHTYQDLLQPDIVIQDQRTADRIQTRTNLPYLHLYCSDRDWDFVQPILRSSLKMDVRPWRGSTGSWHFYRHSFAGWGLSGWERLEVVALAGKTRVTIRRHSVIFVLDRRTLEVQSPRSKVQSPTTNGQL